MGVCSFEHFALCSLYGNLRADLDHCFPIKLDQKVIVVIIF